MEIIRNHLYALLFFVVFFFFPIFAVVADNQSEPVPESISLTEAIHIAVGQNPEIKAARFQVDAVKSNLLKARSGFYPQLSFAQAFTRTTNPMWAFGTKLNQGVIASSDFDPVSLNDPDAINNFASTFSLLWPIYEGGRTKLDWEQAKQKLSVASLALERTRQNVIAQTATAYVGLVLAQKDIGVINEALKTAKANIKMIRSRYSSGLVVKSDLLRAMVRRADLEQKQLMAKSRLKIGEAMLNAVMGSIDAKPLNPVTPLAIAPEIAGTVDYWINTALQNRPEMENLFLAEDIAKKEIKKSRAHHYPDVNLVGNYEINSQDFSDSADNYTIGAVLKINIFSGHRISEETKAAVSMLGRVQQVKKNMKLNIQVQTQEAFLKSKSARKRIQVAKTALNQAEENLRIVKNRYNNGLLTIVGLLDAEVARQQAHTDYFKALHDFKVASIELALASGTIDADFQ